MLSKRTSEFPGLHMILLVSHQELLSGSNKLFKQPRFFNIRNRCTVFESGEA